MSISEVVRAHPEASRRTEGRLSVVVPTRHEAANVARLLDALVPLTEDVVAEVVFVDDSDDETPELIRRAAGDFPVPVFCLHRGPGDRTGGLSGAVIEGMRVATSPLIAVMDADLQHPPETLVALRDAVDEDVDLAYGSRFADGGTSDGLASPWRARASRACSAVARTLFPHRLRGVSDPMSGFFVVRRRAIDLDELRPTGFKVLLELLVRHDLRSRGVGFAFAPREAGTTKASWRVAADYLVHLVRLRSTVGRFRQGVGFALVGATGLVVNHLVLWALVAGAGWGYGVGAIAATQASTAWNFVLNDRFVFGGRAGGRIARFARFWSLNNVLLLLRVPLLALLVSMLGVHYLLANLLSFVAIYVLRFVTSDRWVWRDPVVATGAILAGEGVDGGDLVDPAYRHTYDIAGVITVASEVELRELERFAAHVPLGSADVELRRGLVGRRRPGSPKVVVSAGTVFYTEHLGGLIANFAIDMSGPIDIRVSPVLAASPHVVYTNIVEALLRFLLVSRGHMLIHSATLELDGVGVMLSARTDTGKTGTVLRLVREKGAVFLSDDMTIIRPDGTALTYPKPLTISAHTLAAVAASPMRRAERAKLAVQSRIHSREGRSLGAWLARRNLPIMAFNAVTQVAVPPPKYHVDRLVPTVHGAETAVSEVFIIERGDDGLGAVDEETARRELLDNTDDAYGFPPFAQFAPAIAIGDDGYLTLRAKEETILVRFLRSVRVRRLRSSSFAWADEIPRLLPRAVEEDRREAAPVADGEAEARNAVTSAPGRGR